MVVEGGRIAGIGEPPAGATVVDVGGGLLAPGFVDAHVHAVQGGIELTRCNLAEGSTREEYLAHHRGVRPEPPGRALDPRWGLGDGGVPGRYADRGRPRRGRARPAGLPAQPRPPRRLGQHPGAGDRRRPPRQPGAAARPLRARRRRHTDRHPARGGDGRGHPAPAPGTTDERVLRRPAGRSGLPALPGRHRLAGRDRRGVRRHGRRRTDATSRRRSAATSPPTWSARCGGTATPARSRSSRWSSAGVRSPTAGSAPPASR